jgi:membrane fusion protein (multidrug efflux system)
MRSVTFSVLLAALALTAAGCRESTSHADAARQADPVVHVETTLAAERAVPTFITLTGSLVANRTSQVASDASGKVVETFVERGTPVGAGAPLVRLDARTTNLSADEARAMAQAARVQERVAGRDCGRAQELLAQQAINQAEFDRMTAACQSAAAQANAAVARENLVAKALGDAVVRAPFAGVVDLRMVDVGEYVRASSPVAVVVEVDPLRLQLTVPESEVGQVSEGQKILFDVAAYPNEPSFEGRVKYLGAAMRAQSRDLVVEAVVDNKKGKLRPGMFVVAHLQVGEAPLPVIPATAIREDAEAARVYVVREGRIEERLVQLGRRLGSDVAVLSGLKSNEKLVARVTDDVRDGAKVE